MMAAYGSSTPPGLRLPAPGLSCRLWRRERSRNGSRRPGLAGRYCAGHSSARADRYRLRRPRPPRRRVLATTAPPFVLSTGKSATWMAGSCRGRSTAPLSSTHFSPTTPINVASASKWVYGAFVAQRNLGNLSATDRKFLHALGLYFAHFTVRATVDGCLATGTNGQYTPADDGVFNTTAATWKSTPV